MGASGELAFGLRYPDVFSGVYASQPMTNYASSPTFQDEFVQLWGEQSSNLPITNRGPDSNSIGDYDVNGTASTGVWEWMNHLEQMRRRKSDQLAYLMIDHGKDDTLIDWNTQGQPLTRALTDAQADFSIIDSTNQCQISLRSVDNDQTANITPRSQSWPNIN